MSTMTSSFLNAPSSNLDSMVIYTGPPSASRKGLSKCDQRRSAIAHEPLCLMAASSFPSATRGFHGPVAGSHRGSFSSAGDEDDWSMLIQQTIGAAEATPRNSPHSLSQNSALSDCDTQATTVPCDEPTEVNDRNGPTEREPSQDVVDQLPSSAEPPGPEATAGQTLHGSLADRPSSRADVRRLGRISKHDRYPTTGHPRRSRPIDTRTSAIARELGHAEPVPRPSPPQPTWAVDMIVDRAFNGEGRCFYRVKWEDTWEPQAALEDSAADAIAEWEALNLRWHM